ncbi:uncharacterized protein LOC141714920 [Apium graveolens]|uniref:uncharacterized protein LOC141714920 n=1 Tax=Apium graveolens TaxID=4045 RepID=UPI003D792DAD
MRIVAKAWEYLSQWTEGQASNFRVSIQPLTEGDGALYWAKPIHNALKITVDAAIFSELENSGIGIIARDHHGSLLEAMTRRFNEVMNPSMVEVIAIKEALSWAKDKQWNQITIESDCLGVIQLIRRSTPMRSVLGKVIKECRRLISDWNNVEFYFIKRSANMAAHELAQVSHMYPDRSFDRSSVPVKVKTCILDDLNE